MVQFNDEWCDLCDGVVKLYCPHCYKPITQHSHEGDFMCDVHDFVKPVSQETLMALRDVLASLPKE
jgi:predicted amidophosphoribosyltransferase